MERTYVEQCSRCRKHFERGRPTCPHCGVDAKVFEPIAHPGIVYLFKCRACDRVELEPHPGLVEDCTPERALMGELGVGKPRLFKVHQGCHNDPARSGIADLVGARYASVDELNA